MYELTQNQLSIKRFVTLSVISLIILPVNMINLDQVKRNKSIIDNVHILGTSTLLTNSDTW